MTESLAETLSQKPVNEILNHLVEAISDAKGKEISVVNVSKLSDIADYFIIASGRSDRQVQGISNRILEAAKELGLETASVEGLEEGQWVLIDVGDIIVHVFYEATREYYDFDSLWARGEHIKLPNIPDSRHAA